MSINITAIKADGRTITSQASTREQAIKEVHRWVADKQLYNGPTAKARIVTVFFGSEDADKQLEQYEVADFENGAL